jgi:hypothetical protein
MLGVRISMRDLGSFIIDSSLVAMMVPWRASAWPQRPCRASYLLWVLHDARTRAQEVLGRVEKRLLSRT